MLPRYIHVTVIRIIKTNLQFKILDIFNTIAAIS